MGEIGQIPNYQVKVDNWPLFFIQRLHHFYRKKSHCDLTLLFSTLDTVKSIKVHKLVLHACTDYFESLDVMKDSEHGEVLQLSNEMHPDVVIPIISFMYTGKLEFPVTLQPRLYEAATKLRMTILTKLLDVQPNQTPGKSTPQTPEDPAKFPSNESYNQTSDSNQEEQDLSAVSSDASLTQDSFASLTSSKPHEEQPVVTLLPVSSVTPQAKKTAKLDVTFVQRPELGLVKNNNSNQVKAKVIKKNVALQLTTVSSRPKVVDVSLPPTLPGRKLPVWKRKVPFTGSQTVLENVQPARTTFRPAELPKPTRFEWDEELNDPTALKPVEDAYKILSHDRTPKIDHPIFLEDDDPERHQKETSDDSLKSSSDSPPYKRSKSDLQDMKEYGKQQQLRNEIICSEENSEDMMDTDDLYGTCDVEPDDLPGFNPTSVNSSTPKPILKTMSKPEPPLASKRVRFSLEGKENNQQSQNESPASDFTVAKQPDTEVSKQKIVLPMDVSQIQSGKHHVKIVSEVLKKYPNLAKRENIKLRVVSKNPAAVPPTVQQAVEGDTGAGNKSSSSLVSYIFLTNKSSVNLLPAKGDSNDKDKLFDVENKTGPWFCQVCDEGNPLKFESYYTYRRHLVEVHELKIDARICEYCGLRNSKRNHLLYHLYTKHGIDPPAHVSFPKCPACDYIALSDTLLLKHKSSHDPKGLTCYICNVVFKTYSAMQSHLNSDLHTRRGSQREGKQIYRCPYCEGLFGDGDKLGKHIVSVHWGKNAGSQNREVESEAFEPQSGQQLQYKEESEVSNESVSVESTENQLSSELESLSKVASGIATSLSLVGNEQTVVYYDQRTEGQDIGREATVIAGDECKDYIISGSAEDMDERQCQTIAQGITIENEDSNSRTSTTEEVNPTSCSDHDYSEPQVEDNLRKVIPVQMQNQLPENQVIQQILPDQRLVFSSSQGNVVFQSPCVNIPPRVILAPGKVVLPQMSHGDQNVILSQIIPQTQIILSSPILQQPANIMEDGNNAIVFANAETSEHMENLQTMTYQIKVDPENSEAAQKEKLTHNVACLEEEESSEAKGNVNEDEEPEEEEDEEDEEEEKTEGSPGEKEGTKLDGLEGQEEQGKVLASTEDSKSGSYKVETSKIVDDWDETNESLQTVESRNDGPSRPEFF